MGLKRHKVTVSSGFYLILVFAALLFPLQWVVAWLVASMIHECGHLIALRICNVSWNGVKILPYGFRIEADTLTPFVEVICAAAGPIIGLVPLVFARVVPRIAVCAMIQSVCNLLPLSSLDGSRVISGIAHTILSDQKAERVSLYAERAVLFFIGVGAVCMTIVGTCGVFSLSVLALVLIKTGKIKFSCKRSGLRVQ